MIMKLCNIEGCGNKYLAKGLCSKHWARDNRYGNPTIVKSVVGVGVSQEDRFWNKISVAENTNDCWPWRGTLNNKGYPQCGFKIKGKRFALPYRIAYLLHYKTDPESFNVCHKCDNPLCCNPNHLFLGTQQENMLDCSKKNRISYGENHPHSKLTEDNVRFIRNNYSNVTKQLYDFASKFNVSFSTIYDVVKYRTWRRVS